MSEFDQENKQIEERESEINSIESKVANLLRQNPNESPDKLEEILHEEEIAWKDVEDAEGVLEQLSEHEKKAISDVHEKTRRMARVEDDTGNYWEKLRKEYDKGNVSEVEIIDRVRASIEDLENEADELELIAHIAEIICREIRKAGKYTLELSELERRLLKESLVTYSKGSTFSQGHNILGVIEADIEQNFVLIETEEETAETVRKQISVAIDITQAMVSDLENICDTLNKVGDVEPEIFDRELYIKAKEILAKLRQSLDVLQTSDSELDVNWSEIEEKAEDLPQMLRKLEDSNEGEVMEPDKIKYSLLDSKGSIDFESVTYQVPSKNEESKVIEYLAYKLREQEQITYKPDVGEERVISGMKALSILSRLAQNGYIVKMEKPTTLFEDIWVLMEDREHGNLKEHCFRIKNDEIFDNQDFEWVSLEERAPEIGLP